ncbi:hypothetical protein TSOC_013044 [Tetrabaena socialis]|uniref:Uncharacterized protein n=1 Tax=Tetrabaena socialis TaxID=47790 RepID=A0A2J7ZLE6_9CHLO|nr:hypothetical protein TSOC_013044 [Tetrabaena socialis]|eukprot:PNH01087.1 hypothetical protein TSOC_013044 [Tetrabaena socialis]
MASIASIMRSVTSATGPMVCSSISWRATRIVLALIGRRPLPCPVQHRLEAGLRYKELVGTVGGVAPSSAAVFRSQDCIEVPSNDQVLTGCLC